MSDITPNQWTILERLEKGPEWIRSFQPAKPLLNDLIDKGLVERCRPHLGHANNMVRLTAAGCEKLGVAQSSIPTERPAKAPANPPRAFGEVQAGLSDKVRSVCETFLRAVKAGERVPDVVQELAAREDVQRPAIWKRLRMGGVLPAYRKYTQGRKGRPAGGGTEGFSADRFAKALAIAETNRAALDAMPRVDRDPCPRCGVRGDIDCGHNRAPLRMVL